MFLDDLQELCLVYFNDPKNRFYDNIFLALKSICAFGICPILMEKNEEKVLSLKRKRRKFTILKRTFKEILYVTI